MIVHEVSYEIATALRENGFEVLSERSKPFNYMGKAKVRAPGVNIKLTDGKDYEVVCVFAIREL